jgi:hypothetical protein
MGRQDFDLLVKSGLLAQVEKIVVEAHRELFLAEGRQWSRPIAYRWLRYEDPMPVARLAEGTRRLRKRMRQTGGQFDREAVDKACAEGAKRGFLI